MASELVALAAAGGAVAGSAVTGLINYYTAKKKEEEASKRARGQIYVEKEVEHFLELNEAIKKTIEGVVGVENNLKLIEPLDKIDDPERRAEQRDRLVEEFSEVQEELGYALSDFTDAHMYSSAFLPHRKKRIVGRSLQLAQAYSMESTETMMERISWDEDDIRKNVRSEIERLIRNPDEVDELSEEDVETIRNVVDSMKDGDLKHILTEVFFKKCRTIQRWKGYRKRCKRLETKRTTC